jgi:hypothetical protein
LILWWDTGRHAAREEPQIVELAAASFDVGPASFLVSALGPLENGGGAREAMVAVVGIKP